MKNKLVTVAILTLFLLSATAISCVSAQLDPTRNPDSASNDSGGLVSENPTLYSAQDNSIASTDGNPILDRSQDDSTPLPNDNATLYTTQEDLNDENAPLIAPAAQPADNTFSILGIAVLTTIIAVSAVVAVHYGKKN